MTTYAVSFRATDLRGVEHVHHHIVEAASLDEATDEAHRIMQWYVSPPLYPPVLLSVECDPTLADLIRRRPQ